MRSALSAWQTFLDRCLLSRLSPEEFTTYARILKDEEPLPAARIANLFLAPRGSNTVAPDPRIVRYVQALLSLGLVNVPTLLHALLKVSSNRRTTNDSDVGGEEGKDGSNSLDMKSVEEASEREKRQKPGRKWSNSYSTEETLFYRITKYISSGTVPTDQQEAVELLLVCTRWIDTAVSTTNAAHHMLMLAPTQTSEMAAQNTALGALIVAVVENPRVIETLSKKAISKEIRQQLEKALESFVPVLLHSSPPSAARLEVFRTETMVAIQPIEPKDLKHGADAAIEDILGSALELGHESMVVEQLPVVNTRAGLYVYLNSLLAARPLIDDSAIFAYLNNRYQGDVQSSMVDLILAAFDVLANATFRNELGRAATILRSFLVNKIPLLLVALSSSLFPPLTSEHCIAHALSQVDTTVFPTLADSFDETSANSLFSDSVRQDFCFACCLHGLIEFSSIEDLLGDTPMQDLPAEGRYVKENLVQQCLSDPEKVEGLIDELEQMNGNVGAVSQAITEVIKRLCSNRETITLKGICTQLAKKPASLDVMLMFDHPMSFLHPLCDLLDNWRYDEDQGEYQPVYEEFGAILLLVLSFTYRYGLSTADLGIQSPQSFVAKLLNQGYLSRPTEDLSEQEASHLDGWTRGLFDNESGGLGDELMSSCPPQEFYLLVPTLFQTIVLGCSTKYLSDEGLKGGLEYLVDTFLLPSLVPGINWLAAHLWESRGDANAVLQVLSALITNPASISNNAEASQMLNSILNIVATKLEQSLRWLQRAEPSRQDIDPLIKAFRGNLNWERRGSSEHTELEAWTAPANGGFIANIKSTMGNLVQWGLNPGLNAHPANYTHRQILVGVKMLTAKRVLSAVVDELKVQTENGNGSAALDVACAIVCAPDAASWSSGAMPGSHHVQPQQRRMNLREALLNSANDASKLHKTDPFLAETIVRLYRKVEAQLALPQPTMLQHDELGALNSAIEAVGMDAALGTDGLGGAVLVGDGLGVDTDLGLGGHDDLMSGLISGTDDLLFGTGDDDMGNGMGF